MSVEARTTREFGIRHTNMVPKITTGETVFRNTNFIATATGPSPQADGDESHLAPLVRREIHLEQNRDQIPRFAGRNIALIAFARIRRTVRVGDELVKFDRARAVGQRIGRTL
jgi:hypothetical protein